MSATKVSSTKFDFEKYVGERKALIESKLDLWMPPQEPEILWESMRYSVLSGGKRLRAILCMAAAEACGIDSQAALEIVLPCAAGVEIVHAMSLIHDDLPSMDNDDLRRGKPTNHKVFGEAMALLAGDALLMLALEILLDQTPESVQRRNLIGVASELTRAAGAFGMVGGQVLDLSYTGTGVAHTSAFKSLDNNTVDEAVLATIHKKKTGALIRFSVWSGAKLASANERQLSTISEFGDILGLAFQIADDLLDVTGDAQTLGKTPGKDEASQKATWVRVFGVEESQARLRALEKKGLELITSADFNEAAIPALGAILNYAIHRKKLGARNTRMDLSSLSFHLITTFAADNANAMQSFLNGSAPMSSPLASPDTRGWQVILVTILSSVLAQSIKIVTKLVRTGQLDLRMVAKTGGMPSSHSCCTMGMAVSVGLIEGFNSVSFAIALCLAFIVMYDAAGVRRTVGLQAKVLNQMMTELFSDHPRLSTERIKEFLGHTPKEVFVGAILGSVIAYVFNLLAMTHFLHNST